MKSGVDFGRFHPCEGNIFKLWSAFLSVHQYYFNEAAAAYQYVLLDLDGNGVLELITQEVEPNDPQHSKSLRIQTIKDGELVDLQQSLSYICEGVILKEAESDGINHAY